MKELDSTNTICYRKDSSAETDSVSELTCKEHLPDHTTATALKSKVSTAPSELSCSLSTLKKISNKSKSIKKKKQKIVLKQLRLKTF